MTFEFTPRQILFLLRPSWQSVRNRRRNSVKSDWLRVLLFGSVTLFFAVFVFAGFYSMLLYIGRYAEFTASLTNQILASVSTFILTVLFASTIVTALSTQFLSEDLSLLISSPVPLPALYGSRFVLTMIQASWMVALFSVPIFAALAATAPSPLYFSLAALLSFPPLVVIATAVGGMVTSVLMAVFPARRVREMLVLLGAIFIVLLVFLIRMQQPERLLNPRSIYDVTEFFAAFRAPSSPFLPSAWATSVLVAGRRAESIMGMPLALLWSSAAASVVLGCWLARWLYFHGYSRAQESRPARFSSLPVVDRFLVRVTQPIEIRLRSLLLKDLRTFVRDTTQWSQLLLLVALVVIYLYNFSVLPANFTFGTFRLQNVFSFLNLGLAGFVLSAIAVRFVFTSVSAEGRSFWIIRSSPLTTEQFLRSKFWTAFPPLAVLSQILTVASNHFLGATTFMMVLSSITIFALTFGIVALAVGMGAAFPKFKFENVTQIAGSSGGLLYMIVSTSFVAIVLALEAVPVFLYFRAQYQGAELNGRALLVIAVSALTVFALVGAAAWLPLRWGRQRLETMEL